MNNVSLCGRLTDNPKIRYTASGEKKAIANYTLAVYRSKEITDFINCVAFGKAAEFAEKYLEKGKQIALSGSIRTETYTDKNGIKRYPVTVWISNQELCGSGKEHSSGSPYPGVD